MLLHDPELLTVIDEWVGTVAEDAFDDLLPLLRRAFARYEKAERRMIGEQLKRGAVLEATAGDFDATRGRACGREGRGITGADLVTTRPAHSLAA